MSPDADYILNNWPDLHTSTACYEQKQTIFSKGMHIWLDTALRTPPSRLATNKKVHLNRIVQNSWNKIFCLDLSIFNRELSQILLIWSSNY